MEVRLGQEESAAKALKKYKLLVVQHTSCELSWSSALHADIGASSSILIYGAPWVPFLCVVFLGAKN